MEMTKRQNGEWLEVAVRGRLDAYWADHLSQGLGEAISGGARHIRLDLGDVDYLSSAGIRVLLKYYKQLKGSQGAFLVSNTSAPVKTVMALVGLEELLGLKSQAAPREAPPAEAVGAQSRVRLLDRGTARFEIYDGAPFASQTCHVIGEAGRFLGGSFRQEQCRPLQFPRGTMAVGLGALGHDFQDCQGRFGQFLAVAGAVAYQPTDGTTVPDYQLQAGAFLPDAQVLACLTCEGSFAHLVRFAVVPPASALPFSELASACLDIARADALAMLLIAETASLIGTGLTRSPALDESAASALPREESGQRAFTNCLTLAVGVAAREERQALEPLLQPLGKRSWPAGYFHAAAFSARPPMQGEIDLAETVTRLFEEGSLQGVLRLSSHGHVGAGAEQSRFVRGACWLAPIAQIETERMRT